MKITVLSLLVVSIMVIGAGCAKKRSFDAAETIRGDVQLTVFKSDFGEVTEVREFDLVKGSNDLHIDSISRMIDPQTPLYEWLNGFPAQVSSSSYDLGVGESSDLLKRYEGIEVEMVWYGQDGREGSSVSGVLERGNPEQIVLRTSQGLLVNPSGTLILPDQQNLSIRPNLSLIAKSDKDGKAKVQLSYLTRGLSWSADYVAFVYPNSDDMSLECWASVENRTGLAYPAKKLALVAGSPNRAVLHSRTRSYWAKEESEGLGGATLALPADSSLPAPPTEQGELYRYEIDSPSVIAPDQLNRVKMLGSKSVFIKRDYAFALPTLSPYFDYEWSNQASPRKQNAVLTLTFSNDKTSSLGMPLPAGTVRIYDIDNKGTKRFIGASGIEDTPENAKVNLTLSNVFNVYSEFTIVATKQIDSKTVQKDYQITIHNKKDELVGVRLVAPLAGNLAILSESHKGTNLNARQRQWTIDVPENGETKLRLSIKFKR